MTAPEPQGERGALPVAAGSRVVTFETPPGTGAGDPDPSDRSRTGRSRTSASTRIGILATDAWRTFIVRPVRANIIRSQGGGITTAIWLTLGVAAFAVAAAGVLLGPRIAAVAGATGGTLLSSEPGNPLVVPSFFVPTFFFLLFVCCSLALFGAVLARPLVAAAAVVFVIVAAGMPAVVGFSAQSADTWVSPIVLAAVVVAVPILRWRRPPLPVLQVLALLVAALAVLPPYLSLTSAVRTGYGDLAGNLQYAIPDTVLRKLQGLITPIVFLSGSAGIGFAIVLTAYLRRGVHLLGRSNIVGLVAVAGGLLALGVVVSLSAQVAEIRSVGAWRTLGALTTIALVLAVAVPWWRWAAGGSRHPESGSERAQIPVVALLIGVYLVISVLVSMVVSIAASAHWSGTTRWAFSVVDWIGRPAVSTGWRLLVAVVLLGWALLRRIRSGPSPVAGWVALVGAFDLVGWAWSRVSPSGPPLDARTVAAATFAALLVGAVVALLRRTLPGPDQLATCGALVALLMLLQQRTFVTDPFAVVLGFAGVGFVLFGIVWGFLTSGGHAKGRGLSGLGRSTIMLAYATVPTALLAWQQAAHGGQLTQATGGSIATDGAAYLGTPLMLALVASWLPVALGLRAPRPALTRGQHEAHGADDVPGGGRGPDRGGPRPDSGAVHPLDRQCGGAGRGSTPHPQPVRALPRGGADQPDGKLVRAPPEHHHDLPGADTPAPGERQFPTLHRGWEACHPPSMGEQPFLTSAVAQWWVVTWRRACVGRGTPCTKRR